MCVLELEGLEDLLGEKHGEKQSKWEEKNFAELQRLKVQWLNLGLVGDV